MPALISNSTGKKYISPQKLFPLTRKVIDFVLAEEKKAGSIISVSFVNDPEIHALNKQYRKINRPTDVLSFQSGFGDNENLNEIPDVLGDIVISLETATRQAKENKKELSDEIILLLTHGALHLLDYDHATKSEEKAMFTKTDELIKKFKENKK